MSKENKKKDLIVSLLRQGKRNGEISKETGFSIVYISYVRTHSNEVFPMPVGARNKTGLSKQKNILSRNKKKPNLFNILNALRKKQWTN